VRVVRAYPHDRQAFTQGLVYDGGFLYEGTGLYGESALRKVGLASGIVLQNRNLPREYFGEGITIVGDRIIQLTWKSGVGFVYEKETFRLIRQFELKGEGWGITWDGRRLIVSDGSARLRFLDAETFEEVGSVEVRDGERMVEKLNELEYVDGMIYANVWQDWRIAVITPDTGMVYAWVDLEGVYKPTGFGAEEKIPNGVAYDAKGGRMFVTGKLWPQVFEVQIEGKTGQ
jgi:glutamine cyclotransferase